VDEHDDVANLHLHRALDDGFAGWADLCRFTYGELACSDFIVPAVYQGLFREVCWLKRPPGRSSDQMLGVWSPDGAGRTLIVIEREPAPRCPRAAYRLRALGDAVPMNGPVLLDIDLDFFSSEDGAHQPLRIEITSAEFDALRTNPYHPLRLARGGRIRVEEVAGRHYLDLVHRPDAPPTPRRAARAEIEESMRALSALLRPLAPPVITVARSRHSGFTPAEQWEWIEEALLEMLRGIYPVEVRCLEDIHCERT
jgi:hypothetical protein